MVKPIGNLVANLKSRDKISAKTQARFGSRSSTPPKPEQGEAAATPEVGSSQSRPVRFKKRKR